MIEFFPIPILKKYSQCNQYQNEIRNLVSFIKEYHPLPLVEKETFELVEKESEVIYHALEHEDVVSDFPIRLNRLLTLLHDAHTFIMPKDCVVYPFVIRYYEGFFYVYSIASSFPNCTGKIIKYINGKSIDTIAKSLMEYIPSENIIKACITGSYFLNQADFLHVLGVTNIEGTVYLTFSDGGEVCIPLTNGQDTCSYHYVKMMPHPVTGKKEEPFSYNVIGKICYMQFNSMIDRFTYQLGCRMTNTVINDKISRSLPLFADFLDEMWHEINMKQVSKLIVDMRYNGGGNSILGNILLDFLGISMNNINTFKSYFRTSDFLQKCYPSIFTEKYNKMKGMLVEQEEIVVNHFCDMPKAKKCFCGETLFIQGQNTFSSANFLLTLIKDNNLFPIIGTPTSQSPTCYGDVLPLQLPFTKNCLYISHSYFLRPNETNIERSLYPDINVCNSLEDRLSGEDACWKWILKHFC